jgi:hypothetical protein
MMIGIAQVNVQMVVKKRNEKDGREWSMMNEKKKPCACMSNC